MHITLLGGGFGRKSKPDYVAEAALDDNGKPTAWLHRTPAPTIGATFSLKAKSQSPDESGQSAVGLPFEILQLPPGNSRGGCAYAHRLVPPGLEHSARVCRAVLHGGVGRCCKRDPKDYLLELIGPARHVDPRKLSDEWNCDESPERYPSTLPGRC